VVKEDMAKPDQNFAVGLPSRFAGLGPWSARLILAGLILLMGYGITLTTPPSDRGGKTDATTTGPGFRDIDLYQEIIVRVSKGENYYPAAVSEHRKQGFPLRPFVTVRPPLLASLTAFFGNEALSFALQGLGLFVILAFVFRFGAILPNLGLRVISLCAITVCVATFVGPGFSWQHDVWASLLITASLACYPYHRPGSVPWIGLAIILGVIAGLLRELCMPYLIVMSVAALFEGRRREAFAWLIGLAIASGGLILHAFRLSSLVLPTDLASPGWTALGGWKAIIDMLTRGSLFQFLSHPAIVIVVPLAFVGWIGWRHGFALRVSLWLCGMATVFMLVGRPDNFYWIVYLAVLLPVGLTFAPHSLYTLIRAAR
jgi:hypothetical protein